MEIKDEQGNSYVYSDVKSMEEAEMLAKEMNKKGLCKCHYCR